MTRTAWRSVLEAHSALMTLFEAEMQRDVGISLRWYDVLVHLSEAPGEQLRMNELADSLVLSRSWLTRRIEGMEAAGLVVRCRAEDDARGVCAALTGKGRRVYRKAARCHLEAVNAHFLEHLSDAERETIATTFDRIAGAARTNAAGTS